MQKSELDMEFCTLEELRNDVRLAQMEKYVPSKSELVRIRKFAEGHNEPGVVKLFCDGRTFIVCNKVYDYRNGTEPTLFIVFNAEVIWGDDEKYFGAKPDFIITLIINQDSNIKVPIQHAYYRHIMWEEELDELLDLFEEVMEQVEDFLDELNDDDDDDKAFQIHF